MKIVIVRPSGGGIAYVARRVGEQLRSEGDTVDQIVVPDSGVPGLRAIVFVLKHRDILRSCDLVHVEVGRLSLGAFWVGWWATFVSRVVVVAHDVPVLVLYPGAGLFPRGPGWRDIFAYKFVSRALDRLILWVFRRRVSGWGVMSWAAYNRANTLRLVPSAVIRHGSDGPVSEVAPDMSDYIVFAGTVGVSKGLDTLLEAWSMIAARLHHRLLIVASGVAGDLTDLLRRQALEMTRVEWLEDQPDDEFRRLVGNSALVVCPYREANPVSGVLIHAQAEYRPVVATSMRPFTSEIVHGVNGLLFEANNCTQLAEFIEGSLSSPARMAALSKGARDRPSLPSWADHVSDLRLLYVISASANGLRL